MIFEDSENAYVKAMCLLLKSLEENLYNPLALVDKTDRKIIYASASMLQVYKESMNFESDDLMLLKENVENSFFLRYNEMCAAVQTLMDEMPEKDWHVVRLGIEIGTSSISHREIVYFLTATKVDVPRKDEHEYVMFSLSVASNKPCRRLVVCIENTCGERHYYLKKINGGEWEKYDKRRLTPTESHILLMAGYGLTSDEIAEAMNCSVNTIKTHRTHIMEKLSAKGMVEAMVTAMNQKFFFCGR